MVGNRIRNLQSLAITLLLAGPIQAAGNGPEPGVPAPESAPGSPPLLKIDAIRLSSRPLLFPADGESDRPGFTGKMFRDLSHHLQKETGRETLQNTQAFLSALNPTGDSHLEELRSQRAESLLSHALDEYLDDQLDRLLEEVRVLRAVATFLERVSDYELDRLWRRGPRSAPGTPVQPIRPRRADGDVRLLIDLHPKLRLQGTWGRFNGRVDLPLSGDDLHLWIRREIAPGFSAQLDGTYPLNGEAHLTTLGFAVVF